MFETMLFVLGTVLHFHSIVFILGTVGYALGACNQFPMCSPKSSVPSAVNRNTTAEHAENVSIDRSKSEPRSGVDRHSAAIGSIFTKASLLAGVCFPLGMYWGQSF